MKIKVYKEVDVPQYPEDFYSFKNGVKIKDKDINKWIKTGIQTLENDDDSSYYYYSSGNSIVIILKSEDGEYYIVVSHDYSDANIELEDN